MARTVALAVRIKGCLLLTRPTNVGIVMASVGIGFYIAGGLRLPVALLGSICAGLILAGGNGINDVCDIETDRINNPQRPIPAGMVSRRAAACFASGLLLVGVLLSSVISIAAFVIAASSFLLLVLYALRLKKVIVLGNFTISFLTALAFVFGGVAAGNPRAATFPALFAFLFHLGREIVKDVEDVAGDRETGRVTIPLVFSERAGILAAAAVLGLLVLITPLPFVRGEYGLFYFILVVAGVDSIVILTMLPLATNRSWMSLRRASTLLKGGMVLGLVALAASRV